ncbi:MARVEL-like domain protein [Rutstroemia sp. NJR-2017a BBW]|nr:MARVEL-like domain protein [Rutstroemia sp. NJR-2017a BBW]
MAFGLLLPLRIAQAVFAVVVLGLSGYASHPYIHLAFELLNVLFYFAGFVALSVFLSKLLFCRGSVCAAARADAAFGAFSWLLWCGTTAILALEMFKGGMGRSRATPQTTTAMKETSQPV